MDYFVYLFQFALISVAVFYLYCRRKFRYWSDRGVKGPSPLPWFGTEWHKMVKGQLTTELEWQRKYGKMYGIYDEYSPALVISNLELIKQVNIKDFHMFVNRNKVEAPMVSKMLFFMEGEDWKRVRTICSPAFTSGKLKGMKVLMNICVDKLVNYFDKMSSAKSGMINVKKVIAGFTIDVIASTAFGTETNANDERDKENAFVENGIKLFTGIGNLPKVLSRIFVPQIVWKLLSILIIKAKSDGFFEKVAKEVVKQRRETKVRRNDFVQLLMESFVEEHDLKNTEYDKLAVSTDKEDETVKNQSILTQPKQNKYLSDDEIISQCVIFFLAGFETTATTISHSIFELTRNPDIQQRLSDELLEVLGGLEQNSDQYYDKVMIQLPYLDGVIKETLRKYPPLPLVVRRCGVDKYKLGNVVLEKGQMVYTSIYAVHHNPEYYPESEIFNPDRFMPENKDQLVPYSFMPFGQGPRNCIGMRFAYQEIKLCLAKIVQQFQFVPTYETPKKLAFPKLGLTSGNQFSVKVIKRV